jgi:hypothetical protein
VCKRDRALEDPEGTPVPNEKSITQIEAHGLCRLRERKNPKQSIARREKKREKREGFQDNIGTLTGSYSGPKFVIAYSITLEFFRGPSWHLMDQ